jgi:hypothetical protein
MSRKPPNHRFIIEFVTFQFRVILEIILESKNEVTFKITI